MLFYSNFTTINIWQLVFSLYFLFTFGMAVESRLGPVRFILLITLEPLFPGQFNTGIFFIIQSGRVYFEHAKANTYFFGPVFILFALASA